MAVYAALESLYSKFDIWPDAPEADRIPLEQKGTDWCKVQVEKVNVFGSIQKRTYYCQISTGDLFGSSDLDSAKRLAAKAQGIALVTAFYACALMVANLFKVAFDITSLFWRHIPAYFSERQKRGDSAALGELFKSTIWKVPLEVAQDFWRIARAPLFATGIIFGALYAQIDPYTGTYGWISPIEKQWHEGTSYKNDLCFGKTTAQIKDPDLSLMCKEIGMGKILFLAPCMQKRGNLKDRIIVEGKEELRFKLIK